MEALRFGRRFFAPDALLALVELVVVVAPPLVFFNVTNDQRTAALAATPAALGVASLIWFLVVRGWRAPIGRATRRRLAGEMLDSTARAEAYRAILQFPRRASIFRVILWIGVAAAVSAVMVAGAGFSVTNAV